MIILAVGILGLAPMLVTSMHGNQFSREISEAAFWAQDRIEQLKNQTVITPIPLNETTTNLSNAYTRTLVVEDQTIDNTIPAGVYRITVTMSWTDKKGKSHTANYVTYKAK
jgi:Tfp pilus assembly protein PilV